MSLSLHFSGKRILCTFRNPEYVEVLRQNLPADYEIIHGNTLTVAMREVPLADVVIAGDTLAPDPESDAGRTGLGSGLPVLTYANVMGKRTLSIIGKLTPREYRPHMKTAHEWLNWDSVYNAEQVTQALTRIRAFLGLPLKD